MPLRNNAVIALCLLLGLTVASPLTYARKSDAEQPVVVTAKRSEYSEAEQRQTLTGDVVIKQGSLLIHADKVIVYLKDGAMDRVDANGEPATYQQLDEEGQLIEGESLLVKYNAATGQLVLIGKAKLRNPSQFLSGERIDYNTNTQAAAADGGDERVNIIIQPAQSEQQ